MRRNMTLKDTFERVSHLPPLGVVCWFFVCTDPVFVDSSPGFFLFTVSTKSFSTLCLLNIRLQNLSLSSCNDYSQSISNILNRQHYQ